MAKTLTVRIEESAYKLIEEAAKAENRSVSNFIETAALKRAAQEIFVTDEEMSEIRSDKPLVKRLKSGHRDAVARRGRFV